ncbi:MAG: PAS domain S-box protein [Cyanobacteria bacterium J06638_20]
MRSIDEILLASLDLVFVQDPDGRFIHINEMTARSFGRSRDQLIGQTLEQTTLFPEIIRQLSADHREVFFSRHPTTGEFRLSTLGQSTTNKDYEYTFSLIYDAQDRSEAAIFIAKDITERKRAEVALQVAEAKYQALFEATSDIILILDASSYEILDANWAAVRKLGYLRNELLAYSLYKMEAHPNLERWRTLVRLMELDGDVSYEDEYRRKNGSTFPVEVIARLIEYGDQLCIQSFARDITVRKQAEITLQQQQQQIESIAANVPGAIYRLILHANGDISLPYVSDGELQISGYSPEQTMADPNILFRKVHPEDRPWFEARLREHQSSLQPWDLEYRVVNNKGNVLWVNSIAHLYRNEQGDIMVDGITLDISDRKILEELIQRSERSLTQLLDDLDFAIGRFRHYPNGETKIDFISAGCEQVFGYTSEELTQTPSLWFSEMLSEDWVTIVQPFLQHLRDVGVASTTYRFRCKNGEIRHITIKAIAYHDDLDDCWVILALETLANPRMDSQT